MDFFEVLQLLRRRWPVIVLVTLTGLVAGYVTAPGEGKRDVRYSATTTLLANPQSPTGVNLQQAALLTTTGSVPTEVAGDLGLEDADAARRGVIATADTETGSVEVKAVRGTPAEAEEVSAAFANELVETLSGNDRQAYDEQLAQLNERVQQLQGEVDLLRGPALENPEDEAAAVLFDITVPCWVAWRKALPPPAPASPKVRTWTANWTARWPTAPTSPSAASASPTRLRPKG